MLCGLYFEGPEQFIKDDSNPSVYTLLWPWGSIPASPSVIGQFIRGALRHGEDEQGDDQDDVQGDVQWDAQARREAGSRPSRTIWFIDHMIKRTPNYVATREGQGDSERTVFHGNGCELTEVRLGDPGWTAPSMELGHRCSVEIERPFARGKPFMLSNMECGAHCAIKRLIHNIVVGNRAQGMTEIEVFEWFQKGPVRVLAVEYGEKRF